MTKIKILIAGILFVLTTVTAFAASDRTINSNWLFFKGERDEIKVNATTEWETINLPHSFNSEDIYDDEKGYYRGEAWYRKELYIPSGDSYYFLHFEGVNQEAEVYINNQFAARHEGGYTAFTVPISSLVKEDSINSVTVKVNNRFNKDIPTLGADFSFMGGIYRDVHLIATSAVHFDLVQNSTSGIYVRTPAVTKEQAQVNVEALLKNETTQTQKMTLDVVIKDHNGVVVSSFQQSIKLKAGESRSVMMDMPEVNDPRLWSVDDPYLYRVECSLKTRKNEVVDMASSPLGLRWYKFDAEKGFFLNGEHCKLIGVNRHQDFKDLANALPDKLHENDVRLLKEMGGNFLRVAHYPQDPRVLETCDKLGIVASVEIPVVNYITESEAFYNNCKTMMKEMIHQSYNHPSVIIWAYMNEVFIHDLYRDQPERRKVYIKNLHHLASQLDSISRAMDKERYTMIPFHGDFNKYHDNGFTDIPMIAGWNLYPGWYGNNIHGFEDFLERHHRVLPDMPMIITEYGAGADPRLRSSEPERFDFTLEYQQYYHQHYLQEILKRDYVAGSNVWNLADFSSEFRIDAVPHINNKGLVSYDRRPKDSYYFYQAALLKEPFIAIGSGISLYRSGLADENSNSVSTQKINVFSNQPEVELMHNGISLGVKKVKDYKASWDVPFIQGNNQLEAVTPDIFKDGQVVNFTIQPRQTAGFDVDQVLRVSFGDKREFWDDLTNAVWIPSKKYVKGSWGSIGGKTYEPDYGKSYGSDWAISGTENDPIYQTQITNVEEFKADVPAGEYEITLLFAELTSSEDRKAMAYEIDMDDKKDENAGQRIFNVYVNDMLVLENLNLAEQYGTATAVDFKMPVMVQKEGITVRFDPVKGQAVLNAIEIRRKY
ncbi:glycoside hydrolase family 2 TIM barrel-domain containing protein [Saccharicrinis sp. FJH54]|uniref:glycoside hydrolase family 2 TIM barrel-domain containing protein n=1 Tax=Saccharicrinis sp. FJH54 TaxID=3344665 RepID=UPI0035D40EAA